MKPARLPAACAALAASLPIAGAASDNQFGQEQREKLLLAAKLDTLKFEEHSPAANLQVEAQKEALVLNQIRIFNDASSHFQRVLRGGLLDEQKQKLAEAARERYESQRRANDRGRARAYEACRQPAEQKLVLEVLKRYPSQETLKLAVEATQVAELKEE